MMLAPLSAGPKPTDPARQNDHRGLASGFAANATPTSAWVEVSQLLSQ
jgi:hypothetical protein